VGIAKHMGTPRSNLKFVFNGLIVSGLLYLKFFNLYTAEIIQEYYQLQAILLFLIFYTSVNMLSYSAKYFYSKRNRIPWNKKNNVHFGIENIATFIIGLGLIVLVITLFGVDPLKFITSLTIVAAALAILTKEYIVDFLSGIYLSFSNTFEVGDYVKLENHKGKIVEISMLKVKLKNDDDDVVIIPNSKVHYNDIINYTRKDVRLMTIDFQIALKHIDNIEQLEKDIIHSLLSFKDYIEPKSYSLKVVEMKMDHLDVKFQYTLKVSDMELQRKIRKKTIREVFNFISSRKNLVNEK
jgi:MscS family membrane protein